MWSQWHLSAHLLVIAATCLTLVLVVCIWTQYKNKSPSAQVKRSHLLCTLSYPRPQWHRHRDHSATTINLWSLGSWWGVSGRWWNWLQRVLHHKLPWDCFGCWSIAASACILHAVLVFGALPCRILADAAMWLFKVAVAVRHNFYFDGKHCLSEFFPSSNLQKPLTGVRGYTGQWEADQGMHLSPVTGGSKGGEPTSLWLMPNTCLYFCNCA